MSSHAGGPDVLASPGDDAEPFDDFYRRELPHLLVLARALVGAAYAEDVALEALLVAYRRWRSIAVMRSPAGYVRGVCLHKAVTVARRRTREGRLLHRLGGRRATEAADDLSEDSSRFWQHVRALPRRQAQVVALHYALDLSVTETAEILECAEGTVRAHLYRARMTLAATLRPGAEDPS
jgi:RNA polymerase sigma-70 factor (ECF subfamily)